ncbi:hypothetical protein EBME_1465 [bacterium endosymbiont of Mortierella elongata FMR23-6]|nr:hypothetical protein EBME_1465 [bacterium endosymbiont of Mortierella elongata FMR23-6]
MGAGALPAFTSLRHVSRLNSKNGPICPKRNKPTIGKLKLEGCSIECPATMRAGCRLGSKLGESSWEYFALPDSLLFFMAYLYAAANVDTLLYPGNDF